MAKKSKYRSSITSQYLACRICKQDTKCDSEAAEVTCTRCVCRELNPNSYFLGEEPPKVKKKI